MPGDERLPRPRLLVLGRKNSGKSSLINLVLGRAPGPAGRRPRPNRPEPAEPPAPAGEIILHPAGGPTDFYELVSPGPGAAARRDCLERLEDRLDEAEEAGRRPHLAWLCLDAARGRAPNGAKLRRGSIWPERVVREQAHIATSLLTRLDRDLIEIALARRLPLALVLTKADLVSAAEAEALIARLGRPRSNLSRLTVFESSLDPHLAPDLGCPDRLIDWSLSRLGGRRRAALAGAARAAIEAKARLGEECVSRYAKAAALAGLAPLPLIDLLILAPIQTAMLTRLALIWNGHADESSCNSSDSAAPFPPLAGLAARCASTLSRMLAGNLLKLWPGAGMLIGGLVNVGVAGLMTWGLGRAVNSRLEKYARLALSGQAPPPEDFWDLDALAPLVELYTQAWDKYSKGDG